jgi:hypothetical protein
MLSRSFAEGAALGSARWSEGCNQLKLAGSAFMRPLHLLKRRAYPSPILRFLVIASPLLWAALCVETDPKRIPSGPLR